MCPDLWITSLLFDLNYELLTGASLLALAKSIYYKLLNRSCNFFSEAYKFISLVFIHFLTADRKKTFQRTFSYNSGCKRKL